MNSTAEMIEERIRERAYYIWEANGRPLGRDKEFWQLACELIAMDASARAPKPKRTRAAQQPRVRNRKVSASASSEVSAPVH
jgi:hypothetical protein